MSKNAQDSPLYPCLYPLYDVKRLFKIQILIATFQIGRDKMFIKRKLPI